MKLTDADVRRMSNLSDAGFARYIAANPKINLDTILSKAKTLSDQARQVDKPLEAQKYEDLIEGVNDIKSLQES